MPRVCLECGDPSPHFLYPRDEATLYAWLEALDSGNVPRPKDKICLAHFSQNDYVLGEGGRYHLRKGALPVKVKDEFISFK